MRFEKAPPRRRKRRCCSFLRRLLQMLGLRGKPLGERYTTPSTNPTNILGLPKHSPSSETIEMPHKPKANGVEQVAVANGTMAPSPSRGSFSHLRSGASSVVFSAEQNSVEMTIVHARKRMITALVNVDDRFINEMSIEAFIDFLNKARLTSMPHRGSRWDKALRSAEYFALQISSYAEILDQFAPGSHSGVNVGLASCCLLLQVRELHR